MVRRITKPSASQFLSLHRTTARSLSTAADDGGVAPYLDIPKPRRDKSERKPYPTPMRLLLRRARLEKVARKAEPVRMLTRAPDNGLLVPGLVPVAHGVYRAHSHLISGLSRLVQAFPVHRCLFCSEVHIGRVGHEIRTCDGPGSGTRCATHVWKKGGLRSVVFFPQCFHLYDRVGKPRVSHDEQNVVPRIPAIVELCSQAGVDLKKFPTKRRTRPVYSIDGRIVDFEQVVRDDDDSSIKHGLETEQDEVAIESREAVTSDLLVDEVADLRELSIETMRVWFEMISGAKQMMKKYPVWTCGYCPEVQVGPKGHRVRMCKATKHQARDGQHAWQEARIDDLVGPNYVWHATDPDGPPLDNKLKRFYGKAPGLVELCVQAGAPVPDLYRSMMRLDVVPPGPDEVDLVA